METIIHAMEPYGWHTISSYFIFSMPSFLFICWFGWVIPFAILVRIHCDIYPHSTFILETILFRSFFYSSFFSCFFFFFIRDYFAYHLTIYLLSLIFFCCCCRMTSMCIHKCVCLFIVSDFFFIFILVLLFSVLMSVWCFSIHICVLCPRCCRNMDGYF